MKIFISYRRADSRKDAGRIYDRLVEAFGKENVFKDVDSIPIGKDFRGILREAVAKCDVELVIIGKQWLDIRDEAGSRRLENPGDFVRIEVESALQRDSCLVVPVLVDNASMPQADELPINLRELAFKHATSVRDDPDFHGDVSKIIRGLQDQYGIKPEKKTPKVTTEASTDIYDLITAYYQARKGRDWDSARQLLAEIRSHKNTDGVFDVDAQERYIWQEIEREEAEKRYRTVLLIYENDSAEHTWLALQKFWQDFPNYDPNNIGERVQPQTPPPPAPAPVKSAPAPTRPMLPAPFDWIEIPGGRGTMKTDESSVTLTIPTETYWISKYPITNAQFAKFIEAGGYKNQQWWTPAGWAQREKEKWTEPRYWTDSKWNGVEHPVVGVSWFESVAFCLWLSNVTGEKIMLPTEAQWQYAAQGTDGREYPWGKKWDASRCNNNVDSKGIGKTSPVRQYEGKGDSPFGVVDMAGNVWEWCLTDYENKTNDVNSGATNRVLRGGSWDYYVADFFRCDYRYWLNPYDRVSARGFRVSRFK
jgi:formylglycine-generating enzyme required for sulfatase activity